MEGEQVIDKAIKIAKVLVMEALISVAALCLFALILMRFQPSESGIRMGVRILYIIVNLIGGFLIGKIMKQKKFLWGVITGLIYFVIISIISCGRTLQTAIERSAVLRCQISFSSPCNLSFEMHLIGISQTIIAGRPIVFSLSRHPRRIARQFRNSLPYIK